jgi:hypothetical protein
MKVPTLFRPLAIALIALVISACATRPIAEWQDESFSGPINNLLIIGVSDQETSRRLFEDTFVKELAAHKVKAISSYRLMPIDQVVSRETVEAAIEGQTVDLVLVTRLLGVEEVQAYHPPSYYPYNRSYSSYYSHGMQYSGAGYYDSYEVLTLESNLYDTATQQLVWSMQSENFDPSTPAKVIEQQIGLTIKILSERGLVPAKP